MSLPDIHFTEPSYVFHEEHKWYPGTINTIEEAPSKRDDWADQFKWVIFLDGELADDGSQIEQWAFCSQILSPRSKLHKWVTGLLGKGNVPPTINPSQFIGWRVEVLFETYMGQDRDGMPVEKERISNMRKLTEQATAAPTATPVQAAREQLTPEEMPF